MIVKGHDFEVEGYGHPINRLWRCKKCGMPCWFSSEDYEALQECYLNKQDVKEIVDADLTNYDKEHMQSCEEVIMRIAVLGGDLGPKQEKANTYCSQSQTVF